MPSSPIARLKQERERLREEHLAGASGLSIIRALSDATDQAVREIWESLTGTDGAALVATGGYGRRELSPHSDVDLIVLHPKPDRVFTPVKALSYELWDAGLDFAQAVYSPKEGLRLAGQRVDVELSMATTRLVAGSEALYADWIQAFWDRRRWDEKFRARVVAAVEGWRRSGGDAGADLEPNLKDGRGGLRDLSVLNWLPGLRDGPGEAVLQEEADLLFRVRNHLHYATGRRTDVLSLASLPEVAALIEPSAPAWASRLEPEDEVLRTIYLACRGVGASLDHLLKIDRPVRDLTSGFLHTFDPGPGDSWPPGALPAFLALLRDPGLVWPAFRVIDPAVFLELLPEWRLVHCLPQRNVYHRLAVDAHSIEVVAHASMLGTIADELVARVAAEAEADLETLLLAALFHDVGKGTHGGDHARDGAEIAERALTRMGVPADRAEAVGWLVRHHLLLVETAARRDIGDERQILDVAEEVGTQTRLRLLFLLSVADGMATGPAAWGPWKSTLVTRLFTRVSHLLDQEDLVGADASRTAYDREQQVAQALAGYPQEVVEAHLRNMPRAWLLGQPPEALISQSRLLMEPPPEGDVKLETLPQTGAGIWEVTIAARDRAGLFSKIAGALALHGLNVLGAQIYTREDGVALDVFRVEALADEENRFQRMLEDLKKALRGRISLDVRLAEKRRDYAARLSRSSRREPEVVIDNLASDFYTVIEVHAGDRIGLLYDITRALSDLELDVHLAKVSTYADDVVDVFYVRDQDRQKIGDEEFLREIERTILYRLEHFTFL
jgi:[protein-PII] uridylyltransferase